MVRRAPSIVVRKSAPFKAFVSGKALLAVVVCPTGQQVHRLTFASQYVLEFGLRGGFGVADLHVKETGKQNPCMPVLVGRAIRGG